MAAANNLINHAPGLRGIAGPVKLTGNGVRSKKFLARLDGGSGIILPIEANDSI